MSLRPYHMALPVNNLDDARKFYTEVVGCTIGRESERWIDFNFFGHQLSVHLVEDHIGAAKTNPVDGNAVPAFHFGVVLEMADWEALAKRLQDASTNFIIEPKVRFKGEPGEQATMFFPDPSGNALEFKAFAKDEMLFETV